MNKTLFIYIFKKQLRNLLFVAISVFFLILLFDFAEVSRKFSITNGSEILFALKLSLLRTPITFCGILNYIYFITATFSLWDLCRSHQITILKSVGKSPQQILFPFISFSIFIAASWLFIFHPLGIKSEICYKRIIENSETSSSEKNSDIWIDYGKNKYMVFIKSITGNEISKFYLFNLKENKKLFAQKGEIEKNYLQLKNVSIFENDKIENKDAIKISDNISADLIKLLSISPYKQDIYSLKNIYQIEENDKVSLRLYELALQKLLANSVSFILFALIAAIICFPINRYKTKTNIAIKVIFSALFLKFANSMLESLAYTGAMSVILAAWAVTLILICLSVAVLVWKEV